MSDRPNSSHELIGPTGVPAGSGYFAVELEGGELRLAPGRCFVNGRVCVLEDAEPLQFPGETMATTGVYLIYVDAWEQDPARDDPFFTRRPAPGQPHPFGDGLRTLWRPRHLLLLDGGGKPIVDPSLVDPREFESGWRPPEAARGRLQARATGDIAADALYRVEIHQFSGDAGEIRFKSSANNGMTASRLLRYRQHGDAHFLDLESTTDNYPQGEAFVPGKWVEVVQYVSSGDKRSWLGTIAEVEATAISVTWASQAPPSDLAAVDRVIVRQWDRVARTSADAIVGLDADSGRSAVEARFHRQGDEVFEPGDFWLIHASKERNTILWPVAGSAEDGFVGPARQPDGIVHHYCPVGVVKRDGSGWSGNVIGLLPELETITQVATEVNTAAPSDGRVPTEQAVTEYVEGLRQAIDHRMQALREMPVGGIIMWSGAESDIPAGWVLCNGKNNTPDLRSRFIVGAGPGGSPVYEPGTHGGPDPHHHRIEVPAQTVDTSNHGGHTHKMPDKWTARDFRTGGVGTRDPGIDRKDGDPGATASQTGGAHHHSVTIDHPAFDSGTSSTVEIRPQWYALCFIMKT